jgi:hypothetical protein
MPKQDPTEQGVAPFDPAPWVMVSTVPFGRDAAMAVVAKAAIKIANAIATSSFTLFMMTLLKVK